MYPLFLKNVCLGVFAFVVSVFPALCFSSQPYQPEIRDAFEMPWAWTEIENIARGEQLRCFEVAADGTLWLGFQNSVSSHDGVTQRFHDEMLANGTRDIFAASNGQVYVSAARILRRFDGKDWFRYATALEIPSPSDMGVREDPQGRLWIASEESFALVGSEILEFRGRVASNPISDFAIDEAGDFWLVESPSGTVRKLDFEGGRFREEASWEGLMRDPLSSDAGMPHAVHDIMIARDGSVWVVNAHRSVSPARLPMGESRWQRYDLERIGGTNLNGSISQTSDGIVRVSGSGAVHGFDGEGWTLYREPDLRLSRSWSYIKEAKDGMVWFLERFVRVNRIDYQGRKWRSWEGLAFQGESPSGDRWFLEGDGRVVCHNRSEDTWQAFSEEDGLIDLVSGVFLRKDGSVWAVGSHDDDAAASVWSGVHWETRRFPELGGVIPAHLVAEDLAGQLFLGGRKRSEGGLDPKEQPIAIVPAEGSAAVRIVRLPGPILYSMECLPDGRVALSGQDLLVWDGEGFVSMLGESRQELSFQTLFDFAVTPDGVIWVANWRGGLARFEGGTWTYQGESEGLRSNYVADLHLLPDGQLVVLTYDSLDRFDGRQWHSLALPAFEGISASSYLSLSRDGAIWASIDDSRLQNVFLEGSEVGGMRLKTLRYAPGAVAPKTDVRLLSEPELYGRSALVGWSGQDRWFETATSHLRFSYRIDGGEWSLFSSDTDVFLQNLVEGTRIVEVRARDADGNIDLTPAVLSIEIAKPFWKRAWFLAALIAVVVAIATLSYGLLLQRIRHATALDRLRKRFLTNISHELRTPLTLIMAPLEKWADTSHAGSDERLDANMALRNAKRLDQLIDQLLELRKLEVETYQRKPEPCELVGFVRLIVSDHDRLARTVGQAVEFETNAEVAWLSFDTDSYRKILDNLILNALKHSQVNSVTRVVLNVGEATEEETRTVSLVVDDQGTGIGADSLPHIFETFYSEKGSGLPQMRGFGIGLPLVKELVKANKGEISVESPTVINAAETRGARFSVLFAAVPVGHSGSVEEVASGESPQTGESGVSRSEDAPLILIADDAEEIRYFLAREFRDDYEVLEARNGEAALRIAKEEIPDLILADVMMPVMSGIELCREIRLTQETSHIPLVLLTASTEHDLDRLGLESGAVDFLSKPFSIAALKSKLHNLLDTRRSFAKQMKRKLLVSPQADGVESSDSAFIKRVQELMEQNLGEQNFNAIGLSKKLGLSRSSSYRKFKAVLGCSPSDFVQNYRIERSAVLLAEGKTAAETCLRVGYSEPSAFSRAFKKKFGQTPSGYKAALRDSESGN